MNRMHHCNRTKQHYITRQYYDCTMAELNKKCEMLDARAMNKEWTRMQIEAEQDTE